MFCINVWLTVKDEANIPKVGEYLTQIVKGTLGVEPGCLRIEVYHSTNDPARYLLCEHWKSEDDWKGHREEPPFLEIYQPKVLPLCEREPHICDLVAS